MTNYGYDEMLQIRLPHKLGEVDIDILAKYMADNRINDSSNIPAGYTYLSQFITHDISLDELNDVSPWTIYTRPHSLRNLRTPFFDLDVLYGLDLPPNPNMVVRSELMKDNSQLKIGSTVGRYVFPNDLPRYPGSAKAWIVDKRNDENLAIAQTHVAFIRFHNAIVKHLGGANTTPIFEEARRRVIRHYQWIVLTDFLPKIVKREILEDVRQNGNKLYTPAANNTYIPFEFSTAAFRMGHSMVRNSYNWNKVFNESGTQIRAFLSDLVEFTGSNCARRGGTCMGGKHKLPSDWIINWNWFYNIKDSMQSQKLFNKTSKINTTISNILGKLSPRVSEYTRVFSLPAQDLFRARAYDLPSGQAVANRIISQIGQGRILRPDEIKPLLPESLKERYSEETPVWFYLLAEAHINEVGETLGDVGSRIVAEVIIELIRRSEYSVLAEGFNFPQHSDFLGKDGKFGMTEMLEFVENIEPRFLNPLGD